MKDFIKGMTLRTISGGKIEIVERIGSGGQGTVYKVMYNGKPMALKWYFEGKFRDKEAFYDNIQKNIGAGAPTNSFLWPLDMTDQVNESFGYVMDLRSSRYKDFSRFLLAKERFSGISSMINAALQIVTAFRALHNRGYSYQDLNDGNFFVDPKTGDVLICDNDNVAPYGKNLGIAGKCRYMAPEVVTNKKVPDLHTDRFSLAVVLYLLMFLDHPLEGARTRCPCLTEEKEKKFFGIEPLFVYDKTDDSNRPVRGAHINEMKLWPLYPKFIRETFEKAFSQDAMIGQDITHRVMEKDWQNVFVTLRDWTIACPRCNGETFIDVDSVHKCVLCGEKIENLPILLVKKYRVILQKGKKLYACHTIYDSDDYEQVTAEVISKPERSDVLGLRNLSSNTWIATIPTTGELKEILPNKVIRIGKGLKINFGNNNCAEIQ